MSSDDQQAVRQQVSELKGALQAVQSLLAQYLSEAKLVTPGDVDRRSRPALRNVAYLLERASADVDTALHDLGTVLDYAGGNYL